MTYLRFVACTLAAFVLAIGSAAAGPVTVGHSTLHIPCGSGVDAPVDWYKPFGTPTGLVLLVHGWNSSKDSLAGIAAAITDRTGALVVVPTLSSWPFEQGACWLLGSPLQQATAALFGGTRAALTVSAHSAGWSAALPEPFVFGGHSAGGQFAISAAGFAAGLPSLRAVVSLDGGGDVTGTQTAAALAAFSGPVLLVASPTGQAPPGSVTAQVRAARPAGFIGVEVVNGCHLDATGDWFASLLRGCWMRAENVAAYQTIASDWVRNALTGSQDGILGGTAGQQIQVGAATVKVLP